MGLPLFCLGLWGLTGRNGELGMSILTWLCKAIALVIRCVMGEARVPVFGELNPMHWLCDSSGSLRADLMGVANFRDLRLPHLLVLSVVLMLASLLMGEGSLEEEGRLGEGEGDGSDAIFNHLQRNKKATSGIPHSRVNEVTIIPQITAKQYKEGKHKGSNCWKLNSGQLVLTTSALPLSYNCHNIVQFILQLLQYDMIIPTYYYYVCMYGEERHILYYTGMSMLEKCTI